MLVTLRLQSSFLKCWCSEKITVNYSNNPNDRLVIDFGCEKTQPSLNNAELECKTFSLHRSQLISKISVKKIILSLGKYLSI